MWPFVLASFTKDCVFEVRPCLSVCQSFVSFRAEKCRILWADHILLAHSPTEGARSVHFLSGCYCYEHRISVFV